MRPVQRGAPPHGATTYEQMRPTLLTRLGSYCSYCEYPVKHVPHAEHIIPKGRYPTYRNRWDNLLVACTYCNGYKSKKLPTSATLNDYLWPTCDNTARAFTSENVYPRLPDGLIEPARTLAAKLYGLVRLSLPNDDRAKERAEVYVLAQRWYAALQTAPAPGLLRQAIVDLAVVKGFFSIWMEIFAGDPVMRHALISAFPGTATNCFNAATAPIARPGGRL